MILNIYGLFLGKLNLLYWYVTNVHVSCLRNIVYVTYYKTFTPAEF
jgi:hypothetical protein